ncbi:MAG: TonB family protein [Rhodocyclaceae bacterium]|nr:TonB family protein [Rhodocyclaceae bacterium]
MPSSRTPSLRLGLSFLASLLLHGLPLSVAGLWLQVATPPLPLQVALPPQKEAAATESLLKNTLSDNASTPAPTQPPAAMAPTSSTANRRLHLAAAQRKLAEQVFYPAEAVAAGWEGEVRLLLTLDGEGRIVDVAIAAGSGHAVLDAAAERAAWSMGRIEGIGKREMLLPVEFRLR